VSKFVDNQQFEGYATYEKYILVEAVASVVIIWRVVLKMTKLSLHYVADGTPQHRSK
jgi:argininosuccinate synthase